MAKPKVTGAVLGKLTAAFALNANITAACAYAGISRETYYNYVEQHPELLDEIERLQQQPYLKAVQAIVKNLDDPEYALKYAKLRHPQEFSERHQVTDGAGEPIETGHAALKEIAEAIKNANRDTKPAEPAPSTDGQAEPTGTGETAS